MDTVAPDNRFVEVIDRVAITPGIPYHIICGDRGKGGNENHTKPEMTDCVAPSWSFHMPGAKSELIVPSGYSADRNPQAIAEVERIPKQNAKDK